MSVLSGEESETRNLQRLVGKTPRKGLYALVTVNLVVCLVIGLFLGIERRARLQAVEDHEHGEECIDSDSGYLLYDLPLPSWAQGFTMPIADAEVPANPNLLSGAPRAYRNGRHEGVDIFCPFGTPVLAAKDGYVIFAGSDHIGTPSTYRNRLLQISRKLFETPPEILEVLHGMRLVLDHGITDGRWVTTCYSHLSAMEQQLRVGDFVRRGSVVGYVGNSGTSKAGTLNGAHLHFEMRVNGHYLGQNMAPSEAGLLFEAILQRNHHGKPHRETDDQASGRDRLAGKSGRENLFEWFWQWLVSFRQGQ